MNKYGLYLASLVLSVICLTSCLKGINVQDGGLYGVLGYSKNMTPVLKSELGDFYSTEVASKVNSLEIFEGDCFAFYYRIDYDLPENSAKVIEVNGYHTVTVLEIINIPKVEVKPYLTDTSSTLSEEMPVVAGYSKPAYADNYLFITQIVKQPTDMDLDWEMSYDDQNIVTIDGNKRYYDVYMRATVKKDGSSTMTMNVEYVNAYRIGNYFTLVANLEKTHLGSSYNPMDSKFTVRFNYVTDINKETGIITWASGEENVDIALFLAPDKPSVF